MAAISTDVGPLRDVFKQDGPLAAGTGKCGVATGNERKHDAVQPSNQIPVEQSYKVADSIGHLSKEELSKGPRKRIINQQSTHSFP